MDINLKQSAGSLGREIEAGRIDPVELCEAFLDAIQRENLSNRIYARITSARAKSEAIAARQRQKAGMRVGPLDGVPISWKDLFDTAGTATEAGSKLLEGRVPERDATSLRNASAKGLVCLGKTHMSELAFSGLGLNPITQTSPCINDQDAVSGGSSSGAAASVAFGLAAGAIGSDTGGSVRIPAAWNDLVGLKTTAGRISLEGVVPLCARFDTVGPLTRNVEDASMIFAALEGREPIDLAGASVAGLRIADLRGLAQTELMDAPANAYETATKEISSRGAIIEPFEFSDVDSAMNLAGVLFTAEAYGTWRDEIEAEPEKMFAQVRERFRAGAQFSGPDFVAAWQELDRLRAAWHRASAGYDAVILPSSPTMPPKLDRLLNDENYYVEQNLLALRNTRIGNLFGLCALTIPTKTPSCGVMIMAPPMCEERLLRIGAAIEATIL